MALGIPLPGMMGDTFGKAIDSGTNMYSKIMQPILEREKQKQLEEHFKKNMAMKQEHFNKTLARSGINSDLQRQILQQNLMRLQGQNQRSNMLQNFLYGNEPEAQNEPYSMPNQEMGEGLGLFTPEGLQNAQQQITNKPQKSTNQYEALQQKFMENPKMRGQFKKDYGFDPLAAIPENPAEKRKKDIESHGIQEEQSLDIKRKSALEQEIPEAEELIDKIKDVKETIKNNKHLFGPGTGGLSFLGGPAQRKRNLKTKEERAAWGKIEDLFGTLVGKKAQDFSHKGLKVAFDLAATTKPSFEEWPETVLAKLEEMEKGLKSGHERDLGWYTKAGGKPLKQKSSNTSKRLKFNPVTGRLE